MACFVFRKQSTGNSFIPFPVGSVSFSDLSRRASCRSIVNFNWPRGVTDVIAGPPRASADTSGRCRRIRRSWRIAVEKKKKRKTELSGRVRYYPDRQFVRDRIRSLPILTTRSSTDCHAGQFFFVCRHRLGFIFSLRSSEADLCLVDSSRSSGRERERVGFIFFRIFEALRFSVRFLRR